MYFQYGQEETEYLSGKDEKLGAVIAQVGRVNREVDTDLFSAVVHHIVGQQISTKAQATIWQRMRGALGTVDAEHILGLHVVEQIINAHGGSVQFVNRDPHGAKVMMQLPLARDENEK